MTHFKVGMKDLYYRNNDVKRQFWTGRNYKVQNKLLSQVGMAPAQCVKVKFNSLNNSE
jgi:hypothetical protein